MPQDVQSVIFIEWYSFCEKKNDIKKKCRFHECDFLGKANCCHIKREWELGSVHILVYCFHTFSDHTRPSYGVFRQTWQILHMSLRSFFFFYFVSTSDLCSTKLAYSNRYVAHKNPRKKKNECHSVCFSLFLSLLSRLYAVVYLGRKMSIWKKSLDDSILPLKLCPSTQFISCLLCLFSVRMHFRPDLWCQLVAAAFFSIHCWSNNTTSDIYAHK